jgi:hypothetical protein
MDEQEFCNPERWQWNEQLMADVRDTIHGHYFAIAGDEDNGFIFVECMIPELLFGNESEAEQFLSSELAMKAAYTHYVKYKKEWSQEVEDLDDGPAKVSIDGE